MIRHGGYSTVLSCTCQSACPLVFLGGVERRDFCVSTFVTTGPVTLA